MIKNYILGICLIGLLISCQDAKEKAFDSLNQEVMELHDKIMPKSELLTNYKSKLDSLAKGPDSVHVKKLQIALEKADQSMMDWMHNFSLDSLDKMDIKSKLAYLSNQLTELKNIDQLTDSTLNASKKYIK